MYTFTARRHLRLYCHCRVSWVLVTVFLEVEATLGADGMKKADRQHHQLH